MAEENKGKIILDVTETEVTELDDKNNVNSIEGTGMLKVINQSEEHRLWNLNLKCDKISEAVSTTLNEASAKESLEPKNSWDFDYKLISMKEPILKLTETFDTSKNEGGVNNNFVLKAPDASIITFVLENKTSKSIQKIVLKKQLPAYLKGLTVGKCSSGSPDLNLDEKTIAWSIPSIPAGEDASLEIEGRCEIDDSAVKSGNAVDITYESDMNTRSGVEPSIEALTDTMTGVDQEEDDSKPGWWNCEIEFENESDFEVTVKKLTVSQKEAGVENSIVHITPSDIVAAGATWTNKFSVESPSVPTIAQTLDFTANYAVPTRIIGTIHQIPKTFNVLETSLAKVIDPATVKANANTDMKITNTLINEGTASIDTMVLSDVIPKDFEAPSYDQITLAILNGAGDNIMTVGKENATLKITPEDKESTAVHTIFIEFVGLNANFRPGCKLVMSYPVIARNPQPNVVYETPVETTTYTSPKGPGYKDTTKEVPVIGIQYVKRKVKMAKSINPAGREGAFNVTVKINNKGGVELQKFKIIEVIPAGFTAGEFKPADMKPEFSEDGDASQICWKIDQLDAGQALKFQYVVEGSGEYARTEPQVIFEELDSVKKDLSSEPIIGEGKSAGDQEFKSKNAGVVNDILADLTAGLQKVVKHNIAADLIEKTRDQLLESGKSSPALHEFMGVARDLRAGGEKMLVGSSLDDVIEKIRGWKSRLIQ